MKINKLVLIILFLSVTGIIVSGVMFFHSAPDHQLPQAEPTSAAVANPKVANAQVNVSEPASKSASAIKPPDAETVRKDVQENPHGMSAALADFAYEMGKRLEEAKISEETAKVLFTQLESCINSVQPSAVESAQALCYRNAEELTGIYPAAFKDRMNTLNEKTPRNVLRLVEAAKKIAE